MTTPAERMLDVLVGERKGDGNVREDTRVRRKMRARGTPRKRMNIRKNHLKRKV